MTNTREGEKPATIVIFGASGDLTRRKLVPALYNLFCKKRLPPLTRIVGFARRPYGDDDFRARLEEGVRTFSAESFDPGTWRLFASAIGYFQGRLDQRGDYRRLKTFLDGLEGGAADRLYYLATSPAFYAEAVTSLGEAGLASREEGDRNIVVEKPFGRDLATSQALNREIHRVFDESQVFRIDHYLGKETAQNILFLRFANTIFEPVWNRRYVDHVQITVAETVDAGRRAGYYDSAGVLRDMFQNHLLQLLTLVAMEPPASFEADALRNEKVKVLSAVRPVALEDTVLAQYEGYTRTEGVAPDTRTPTYAALKLYVDNWRWNGVPFYLRSGKAMAMKSSDIIIQFQPPPHVMFDLREKRDFTANVLYLSIQPDEGIHLMFETKVPGSDQESRSVNMEFHYRSSFGGGALPEAYQRLLLDAMKGDAALFARSDEIETAWRLIDPVIAGREGEGAPRPATYARGSLGPAEGDALLARDGRAWRYESEFHPGAEA